MILASARRLGGLAIVFIGVTLVIYFMVFSLPGDPIRALGGDRPLPDSVVNTLRERYHLDEPFVQQYLRYLTGLFRGDLGTTFNGQPVSDQLASRWPVTITLALTAWAFELVMGLALGIVAALRAGHLIDRAILFSTIVAGAIPVFVLGVSAQLLLGVRWGWFPVAGSAQGWPTSYFVPALVIALFGLASVSRLMRTSMLESLGADYTRTARAKGLRERRVIGLHVMRNSVIPAATFLGTDLGFLLGGTVVIEGVFNLPGVGNLLFQSIRIHEGPTVVGISTALILIFLVTNLLVDLLHAALDPRIRRD